MNRDQQVVDVLVVGAGSSGATLASRLSEDGDRSVLLLDEGPDHGPSDYPDRVLDPSSVPSEVLDAGWTRWREVELATGRTVSVPTGRLTGGSSAVNGAYFVRGQPADFDGWARSGNHEWSFERVLPAFRRMERDLDLGDGPWHGSSGPVPVARAAASAVHPVTDGFLASAAELGFPPETDKNAPGPPGAGMVPCNLDGGVRVNAAMAYLDPCRDRPNLTIRPGVRVRRVVIEHGRAIGVEVDAGRSSRVLRAEQVVLSAGAVASAQILMLSGIGPAEHLLLHAIDVLVDAPGVGRLSNHAAIDVPWRPADAVALLPPVFGAALFQAALHVDSGLEILAAIRPYGVANGSVPDDPELSLRVGLHGAGGAGRVELESGAPHAPPVIRQRYLSDPSELALAREGVRLALALLEAGPLAELAGGGQPPAIGDADRTLDEWIGANLGTSMHMSGTCAMGPEDDPAAVVDQHCRVRGVEGLRVVDTSVMPTLTSRGPAATAVMIGERAAELFD